LAGLITGNGRSNISWVMRLFCPTVGFGLRQ